MTDCLNCHESLVDEVEEKSSAPQVYQYQGMSYVICDHCKWEVEIITEKDGDRTRLIPMSADPPGTYLGSK